MSTYQFPDVTPNANAIRLVSNAQVYRSPLTGAIQTITRSGERLRATLTFTSLKDSDRREVMALLAKANGQQNRVALRDHSYTKPTGTLSTIDEMLDVAWNATNWIVSTAGGDRGTLSDIEGGVRVTGGSDFNNVPIIRSNSDDGISTPTQGVSYAMTLDCGPAKSGAFAANKGDVRLTWLDSNWGNGIKVPVSATQDAARLVLGSTALDTSGFFPRPFIKVDNGSTDSYGYTQDLGKLSVARCLLVDNGVNELPASQDFGDAAWSKVNSSITVDQAAAIDGLTTADEFIEDSTASVEHYLQDGVTRASAAEYWTATVFAKANTNERIRLAVSSDSATVNSCAATFDLNAGTISSAANSSGSADDEYASVHDYGGGWYRCRISGRIPATTDAFITILMCDGASNTTNYTGDGVSSVYVWGAQLQKGGQIGRHVKTTGAANSGDSQTGSEIWVKGLDVDTDAQLKAGDQVEIGGQLLILEEDLDGDESGSGLLRVRPRLRTAPADEEAVILYKPHGTFLLASPEAGWSNVPKPFSDLTLDFIEDITA